ncbi:MAG: hypothetical protein K5757_04925 [Bacteroidaceae bacterium]|nr:hypothetical protein [Bacteroidaceae bacterium]
MKNAIARDAKAAYKANKELWKSVGVEKAEHLRADALENNSLLNDALRKMIKITD